MNYQCLSCGHEQPNPGRKRLCPNCGKPWEAVNADLADRVCDASGPLQPAATSTTASVVSPGAEELSGERSQRQPRQQSRDSAITPGIRLEVNESRSVNRGGQAVLQIRVSNHSDQTIEGRLSLYFRDVESTPHAFRLAANDPNGPAGSEELLLSSRTDGSEEPLVSIRMRLNEDAMAFWQADLLLHQQNSGGIHVVVDRSVQAETYLGGIDNQQIHIHAEQPRDGWLAVNMRRRFPKAFAAAADLQNLPGRDLQMRPAVAVDGKPPFATAETCRLTLMTRNENGQEQRIQLVSGKRIFFGRARTWGPSRDQSFQPNDIVLRTLATAERQLAISRYHGYLLWQDGQPWIHNLSNQKTVLVSANGAAQSIGVGEQRRLQESEWVAPAREHANDPAHSLAVRVQTIARQSLTDAAAYPLLIDQLQRSELYAQELDQEPVAVCLRRNDGLRDLEQYVLFQRAFLLGANQECPLQFRDQGIEEYHAVIHCFAGHFWIEPRTPSAQVFLDEQRVLVNTLRQLKPQATVRLGDKKLVVMPGWKQHITDCQCCLGHRP